MEGNYAIIDQYNHEIHHIMHTCDIDMNQLRGSFMERKKVLMTALKQHQKFAIGIFGRSYKKQFSMHYHSMNDLINRSAIILIGPFSAEKKLELLNIHEQTKNQLCAIHNIDDGNFIDLLDTMMVNKKHISSSYPKWMCAHSNYPIATFMVMNHARNLIAHPMKLIELFRRDPQLKAIYISLRNHSISISSNAAHEATYATRNTDNGGCLFICILITVIMVAFSKCII